MNISTVEGITVDPSSTTMPLTAMLKQLRNKMASLQSARIQCCCCAVGVFAAMFGIFMLSAGICIVLNVTFMEVDTSGLPPNLHNESGKKVVGIILICVALAFLGLSATVSILYFTLCSRKSKPSIKTIQQPNSNHQKQQRNNGSTPGQTRPKSKEYTSSGVKRMAPLYLDGVQFSRSGAYPRSEYIKPKSYRGRKNPRSRSMLPPHQEEDPEAAKSTMELNKANESHSPRRPSQGRILAEKGMQGEVAGTTSVLVNPFSTIKAPVILIDQCPQNHFTETQLGDGVSIFDDDSVSNACSEQFEEIASVDRYSPYDTFRSGLTIRSHISSIEFEANRQKHFDESELQPPPELIHNIDVRTDLSASGSYSISSSSASQLDLQHSILVVRPAKETDLEVLASSSYAAVDTTSDMDNDQLPDLPIVQHGIQATSQQDSRSESRSSFNSAFSFDGDDPDQSEMKMLQKKMEKLLESDSSSSDR